MTTTPEIANDTHWDLQDLFAGIDDPKIDQMLGSAQARAEKFQKDYKGRINHAGLTAALLSEALHEYEAIQEEADKPGSYAALLFSVDTSDPQRGAFLQKMREKSTELNLPLLFFDLELAAVPDEILTPLLSDPLLSSYLHYIHHTRLYRDHLLSETEERLMEELANSGGRAFDRLFDEVTANAVFLLDSKELTQPEVLARLYSPDRETRRKAAESFSAGLKAQSRITAFVFNTILQEKSVKDRLRGYTAPAQSRHLSNELGEETVNLVVETVVRNYPLVARYYRVKREILGVDTLTHYDRYAPLFEADQAIDFAEAKQIVLGAFNDFSPEMARRAAEFFDKQWIDAAPGKGKQGGAYCSYITPDMHPYVFMNYLGRMKDVMTLAHELGHGVHASLSREQSLLNFHGTLPLAELASTFGEQLVFEKVQSDASVKDKLALYAEKIEGTFATIPRQTAMYRFEQAIHAHRRIQGELSIEDFGNYWQAEMSNMFGDSITLGEEHKLWWSYIGHFTGTPFYVYAYSFGELLVLSLFRQWQQEGTAFADRYLEMLRAGGSLTPAELVAKVGVNLDDPDFWQGGFDVLEGLISRFEQLWAEYNNAQQ